MIERAVRRGHITANPLKGIRKNKIKSARRYVEDADMQLVLEAGRAWGRARLVVALALYTGFLCLRRSVEVRGLTRDQITPAGILWTDGKDRDKSKVLIGWSDELQSTINEPISGS